MANNCSSRRGSGFASHKRLPTAVRDNCFIVYRLFKERKKGFKHLPVVLNITITEGVC